MRQKLTTVLVSLLVVGAVAAVPVSGAALTGTADTTATTTTTTTANNTTSNATIAPGERLSGVIGVQNAEFEGELESRTFGIKVAKAASADAKAEVVATQLNQSQERLEELNQTLTELRQARENGSISQGQYAARVAEARAKLNNVQTMANETLNASEGLPEDVLRRNGVNVTAIETLKQKASQLSGPEVAKIAQTIAGPDSGRTPGDTRAGNRTSGTQTSTPSGTDTPTGTDTPRGNETTTTTDTSTETETTTTDTSTSGGTGSGSSGSGGQTGGQR